MLPSRAPLNRNPHPPQRVGTASGDDPRKVVGIFYTLSSKRMESIQASDWILSADISNLALHISAAPTRCPWLRPLADRAKSSAMVLIAMHCQTNHVTRARATAHFAPRVPDGFWPPT
jgi:hypothetical protein